MGIASQPLSVTAMTTIRAGDTAAFAVTVVNSCRAWSGAFVKVTTNLFIEFKDASEVIRVEIYESVKVRKEGNNYYQPQICGIPFPIIGS
tara:strand:+ start:803 stop:1072 length:270 start_codon:yes stop_codon:yes gene_type:complete